MAYPATYPATFLLITVLAIPGSSDANSWMQSNVPEHNLTLNYTASLNVSLKDILGLTIKSIGNESYNDTITIHKTVNSGEAIKFNATADQRITNWLRDMGNALTNSSNEHEYTFNKEGYYRIAVNGSNGNGTTQTIVWNVSVQGKENKWKSARILAWYPQLVDYVYVNDTESELIEYSITTAETMTMNSWTVDGKTVEGTANGDTSLYMRKWDNKSVGFHTIIYRGSNADSQTELRWYVNVYEIEGHGGGNIFDIIDDALEGQFTDIRIRMFKDQISKYGDNGDFIAQKVNMLHDETANRQMTTEALLLEFKAGNITIEEYVAALKLVQRESKYNIKFIEEMAKFAREELRNENLSREFENLSDTEDDWHSLKDKKKKDKLNKGNKKVKS